jgi:hypothetical protein
MLASRLHSVRKIFAIFHVISTEATPAPSAPSHWYLIVDHCRSKLVTATRQIFLQRVFVGMTALGQNAKGSWRAYLVRSCSNIRHYSDVSARRLSANAQSRCAPARCAGRQPRGRQAIERTAITGWQGEHEQQAVGVQRMLNRIKMIFWPAP